MNFIDIAKSCLNKMSNRAINVKCEPDVVMAAFGKFDIGIYYSAYEYEIGFNYFCCNQKVRAGLAFALLAAGCPQERLPKFLNMSDEQVMQDYITAHLSLVDEFYDKLSDNGSIQQELKKI